MPESDDHDFSLFSIWCLGVHRAVIRTHRQFLWRCSFSFINHSLTQFMHAKAHHHRPLSLSSVSFLQAALKSGRSRSTLWLSILAVLCTSLPAAFAWTNAGCVALNKGYIIAADFEPSTSCACGEAYVRDIGSILLSDFQSSIHSFIHSLLVASCSRFRDLML